jgi:hypothetical protein
MPRCVNILLTDVNGLFELLTSSSIHYQTTALPNQLHCFAYNNPSNPASSIRLQQPLFQSCFFDPLTTTALSIQLLRSRLQQRSSNPASSILLATTALPNQLPRFACNNRSSKSTSSIRLQQASSNSLSKPCLSVDFS